MKVIFLMFNCLLIMSLSRAQFSVSTEFRHGFDGLKFAQNYYGLNAHWLTDNSEFVLGLSLTGKTLDYNSLRSIFDYSHGSPGEYMSSTEKRYYYAAVSYNYLGISVAKKWCYFVKPNSIFSFGPYLTIQFKIREREYAHHTDIEKYYSSSVMGISSSSQKFSESDETFDALKFIPVYAAAGIQLSNRFNFRRFFVQGDLSLGIIGPSIYTDNLGGGCTLNSNITGTCYNYDRLILREKVPLNASLGIKLGYMF